MPSMTSDRTDGAKSAHILDPQIWLAAYDRPCASAADGLDIVGSGGKSNASGLDKRGRQKHRVSTKDLVAA